MSIHSVIRPRWKALNTAGKIEAIRAIWVEGCSASQIAACLDGATRNAIIGCYHRHITHLSDKPLMTPSSLKEVVERKRRATAGPRPGKIVSREPVSKPLRPAPIAMGETQLVGKPLVMLKANECKWPVNQADVGEMHLFCGLPAEGSYCGHHAKRALQPIRSQ